MSDYRVDYARQNSRDREIGPKPHAFGNRTRNDCCGCPAKYNLEIGYPVRSRNSKKHQRFQWHVCEQASSLFSIIPLSFSMPYGIKRETEVDTLYLEY